VSIVQRSQGHFVILSKQHFAAAMKTLFAISIVALLALLWASFSMAQHVRRARRRRRDLRESNDQIAAPFANMEEPDSEHHTPPPPPPFVNKMERVDRPYFNQDSGDLSTTYQGPSNRPEGHSTR
jgi:hypothetical protein